MGCQVATPQRYPYANLWLNSRLRDFIQILFSIAGLPGTYYDLFVKTISLRLPRSLQIALECEARRRHVRKSKIVRECLERALLTCNRPTDSSCYETVKKWVGHARAGVRDLATNPQHVDYFGK